MLSDLVVSCSTGAAAAGYDDEEAIERNGRIYSYSFPLISRAGSASERDGDRERERRDS